MVRPHPAVWRVIHGMVVIYLLVLVFLLFQNVDNARQLMRVRTGLTNSLSQPVECWRHKRTDRAGHGACTRAKQSYTYAWTCKGANHCHSAVCCSEGHGVSIQHLYPELGVDLAERAYGVDCRLWVPGRGVNWTVIHATVFDEFVVAHTLGWWAKVQRAWGHDRVCYACLYIIMCCTHSHMQLFIGGYKSRGCRA